MELEKKEATFNFEDFKNQANADLKSGKTLMGKDGIFTPLIKEFLEAALEGEMSSHMATCLEEPDNQNGVDCGKVQELGFMGRFAYFRDCRS